MENRLLQFDNFLNEQEYKKCNEAEPSKLLAVQP